MADATNENIRRRHDERKRKRIQQMKRRRFITVSLLIIIALLIVIFFTPLFKIRRVEIVGNQRVSALEIEEKLGECRGKNIFRFRTGTPIKSIKAIPYVEGAKIDKSVFLTKITVNITECVPAAYVEVGEKDVILDKQLKVLEVVEEVELDIPELVDITILDVNPGSTVNLKNDDILNVMKNCMEVFLNEGILDGIEYISFEDSENITFNYQERLDVICGGTDNFEKKIKLFNQALNTKKLSDKSRGTIDLSVLGQAVYTP